MPRPRIGMVGYYGYGNYGDELFLQVFRQYLPEIEPIFLQDQLTRPFYTTPLADKIADLDAILIGGGDLVIPDYWTDQYFEREFLSKPVYLHGIGVPTWGGEQAWVVEKLARFFSHPNIRHIHVRDEESRAWIEKNLAPRIAVDVTPDIVCALDLPEVARPHQPPVFGLISRRQKPGEIQWRNVRALCDRAVELGFRLRHIVLGTGPVGSEDRREAEAFEYPGMEVVSSENIDDLTRSIGECSVLASMKFHGCVVAYMYGVPAVGLITTDKFRNFYKLVDRPELVAHHTYEDLAERLQPDLRSISTVRRKQIRGEAAAGLLRLRERLFLDLDIPR